MNFDELTSAERLIAEQAVLNLRTLNAACDEAADGTVIAIGEAIAVDQGRELTRKTLQAAVAGQVESVQKKFARPGLRVRIKQVASWSQVANSYDNRR